MTNIYAGCVSSDNFYHRTYDTTWDEQLDALKQKYEEQGYKVVFVFLGNSFQDVVRVVLYNKDQPIPSCMQEYRHKYVRFQGHWYLESQLGICDKCGNYAPLVYLCSGENLCKDCSGKELSHE